MDLVKNLRDHFLTGLRKTLESFRNQPGLTLLRGGRSTEDGIRPLPAIDTESNIDAGGIAWPFPQLFRFMDKTLYINDVSAVPRTVDETVSPWTITPVPIVDKHGNAQAPSVSGLYDIANFGAFTIMTNGLHVLFQKEGGDSLQLANEQVRTVCNYKNSQLVMGGFGPSSLYHDALKNFLTFRQALESEFPLPDGTPYTGILEDLQQWIWWCSVGGGDAFMFFDPHELLLPAYSDVTLEVDHILNGDFESDATGWILGSGWTHSTNKVVASGATDDFEINESTGYSTDPAAQKYYLLTFTWTASSGTCFIKTEAWESENLASGVGPITLKIPIYFDGNPAATPDFKFIPVGAFTGEIDNVTLKEIVKHKQNYNPNLPSILSLGLMKDVDKGLIDKAWGGADGVSSFSAVPRSSVITNGNMYAGADSDDHASRYHKMFEKANWGKEYTTASNYLTQGFLHVDEVNPFYHLPAFNYVAFDDAIFYDILIHVVGRTVGSIVVVFGAGSGFDTRKNTSPAITVNGETLIRHMQTDTNPGTLAGQVRVVPTDDFDGAVVLLHVEDKHLSALDAYAMESHTNHINLVQQSSKMNSPLIAGNRYRVKWKQMTYTPTNILRDGVPIFYWDEDDYGQRPVNAKFYWTAEDGTSHFWTTPYRNILSNSLFYKSQILGWVLGGNWFYDIANDEMDHSTPALEDRLTLPATRMYAAPVHGRTYDIIIEIRNRTAGQVFVRWGENNVGDNQWQVPAGNGFFRSTIKALNTATDWTRFIIATDAAFDGSVGEVMALDPTRSVDPHDGVFEIGSPTHTMQQGETFMHCYPLVEGQSYELQWELVEFLPGAPDSLVFSIGGGFSTSQTSPGVYTETIVCGSGSELIVLKDGVIGSVTRIRIIYLKPLFNEGVRPKLAAAIEDTTGVSNYFENTAFGIYEEFSRTIRVPSAPANLDLEFEFQHGAFPVRITDVEIEPFDSEVAIIDMQPKPKIFDYFERNEAGFAPIPWPGILLRLYPLGDYIMAYGDNYVCYIETFTAPIHAKVAKTLAGYPKTLGVASEGACFGDENEHLFVDEKGELWHVQGGGIPQVTKLGYKEYFSPMLGNEIVVTRDQDTEAWNISDGVTGYYFRDGRLSETPYGLSFLEFTEGGLVGHKLEFDVFSGAPELTVLTNPIDGEGMGLHEITKVQVIGRGSSGAYALGKEELTNRLFTSDLSGWTLGGDDWSWFSGRARCAADVESDTLFEDVFASVSNQEYETRIQLVGAGNPGAVRIEVANAIGTTRVNFQGEFIETLIPTASGPFVLRPQSVPLSFLEVEEVSCRERRDANSNFPIPLPFAIYVDAKLYDGATWTRFGPFWPDARGMTSPKITGVEFRIMVQSGNANLVELDDIRYLIRDAGKFSVGKWVTA